MILGILLLGAYLGGIFVLPIIIMLGVIRAIINRKQYTADFIPPEQRETIVIRPIYKD